MPAMELVSGNVLDAGTLIALTPLEGNSFTMRNTPDGTFIRLLQAWVSEEPINHYGELVIRSPLMHDNIRGISLLEGGASNRPLLNNFVRQNLVTQDTLTIEALGGAGAAALTFGCLLIYYEDLIGVSGHFITADELLARSVALTTVENTITATDTGQYTGAEPINAESDLLKPNTEYALIGYVSNITCAAIRYRASSWGNLGLGGPVPSDAPHVTSQFFTTLSLQTGLPLIPVFNSAERANVLVDVVQDEAAAAVPMVTYLAQLS